MLNRAILMGRLVADPELRQTPNGISVTAFCIAVERNYSKDKERQADFINIVAWRQTAEFVSRYFSKGKMIIIEGSIQTRSYEDKNGNKRTAVEVVAGNVMFGETKSASNEPSATAASQSSNTDADSSGFQSTEDSEDLPF